MLLTIVVAVTPSPASAANLCVEPSGAAGCFTTIQDAVDNAVPGDNILVRRGTYIENVVIPAGLDGLTVRNQGSSRQIVLDPDAPNTGAGMTIEADDVTIRGLTIRNGRSHGVHVTVDASGVLIDRVRIEGTDQDCVRVEGPTAIVRNSTMFGCGSDGVDAGNTAVGLVVERNRISNCDARCLNIRGDDATVRSNIVSVAGSDGIDVAGDGMQVVNNRTSRTVGDGFRIDCSPCTGALVQGNQAELAPDGNGFRLSADAPGMTVRQNKARHNGDAGFTLSGDGIRVERNLASNNGTGRSDPGFQVRGSGHELVRNTARDNGGDGYRIGVSTVAADSIALERNLALNNLEDGFDLAAGDGSTLDFNRAINNLGVGFEVSAPVTNAFLANNTGTRNRVDFCDEGTGTLLGANRFATTGPCAIDD